MSKMLSKKDKEKHDGKNERSIALSYDKIMTNSKFDRS